MHASTHAHSTHANGPTPWRALFIPAALAAALLAGCATPGGQDATVQAFSGLQALPTPATYRFERLPSQAGQPSQDQVEALADPVLHRAGLRRDDAAPRFAVQVSSRFDQAPVSGFGGPSVGVGIGVGRGGGSIGLGVGSLFPGFGGQARTTQQASVLVRELATNRVVFESQATAPGAGDSGSTAALIEAALQGFPNPPPGARRVVLGGAPAPAAGTAIPATVVR